jgi:lysozyme
MDPLSEIIIQHEGLRLKPYTDTSGDLTIGVGRNLTTVGISQDEAVVLLTNDLKRCDLELLQYDWYTPLDDVRKGVLIELVFNIGLTKIFSFKNMIDALKVLNYQKASSELLKSVWAGQVGPFRSNNMAFRLLTGKYSE